MEQYAVSSARQLLLAEDVRAEVENLSLRTLMNVVRCGVSAVLAPPTYRDFLTYLHIYNLTYKFFMDHSDKVTTRNRTAYFLGPLWRSMVIAAISI